MQTDKVTPGELIQRLVAAGVELHPCSDGEVDRLELACGLKLPRSYKAFLSAMGRGAGEFLKSDHWEAFYDSLLGLNSGVRNDLVGVVIPPTWYCFASRNGEVYLFFDTAADDDPPIHFWNERNETRLLRGYDSFWDWFREMLDGFLD